MVVIIVMGACGCGKSSVAERLSEKLQCVYKDGDEFHSDANKQKMSSGIPLTDEDRVPWLTMIHEFINSLHQRGETGVVTCSALKKRYRQILCTGTGKHIHENIQTHSGDSACDVLFVYLKGTKRLLSERMQSRTGHFMPAALLDSQLSILQEPDSSENHVVIDIDKSIEEIVLEILAYLSTRRV